MSRVVRIKCPCGAVFTNVTQPDRWPKDKVSRGNARCNRCGKNFKYQVAGGICTSWYC